jgi:hypothetical protein
LASLFLSPSIHLSHLQSTSVRQVKALMKIFNKSLQIRHLRADLPKTFTEMRSWQDLPEQVLASISYRY